MARKKTSQNRLKLKTLISNRLREVRQDLFGEHGGPELARRLNLPARTWYNYETGVTVPAEVLLAFIDQTGVNPVWLLSGEGPRYRRGLSRPAPLGPDAPGADPPGPGEARGAAAVSAPVADADGHQSADFVAVGLVDLDRLAEDPSGRLDSTEAVMVYRQWLPRPSVTVAARLDDDAMSPILPAGSVVAVDRSIRDPERAGGQARGGPGRRPGA